MAERPPSPSSAPPLLPCGHIADSWARLLRPLLDELSATAAERDRTGGTAKHERNLFRHSGLLGLTVPASLGGLGGDLRETLAITRRIAAVDSSLAHLFAFHHLMLATLQFYGARSQWTPWLEQTVRNRWFWGNALNPLDRRTTLSAGTAPGQYRISGNKSFCSGASDSDMLIVSALDPSAPIGLVVGAMPTARAGITVHDDWDNMGQRQTDSGSVSFNEVIVYETELLREPGPLGSTFASLRSCLAQLILAEIYQGLAEGALTEAVRYAREAAHPWIASQAQSVAEDPYVLRNFGDYWSQIAAAGALVTVAEERFQLAFDAGERLTAAERGELAVLIAAAKVSSSSASLSMGSRMFEVMGARATTARLRFDRFWRNARTHTLHDPLDYKLHELGRWALTQQPPTPSFYS